MLGISALGGAAVTCGAFIAWCAWMTAAPVTAAANVGVEMSGGPNSASPLGVTDDLGTTISRQAQARHIFGTSEWAGGRRGGYFTAFDDAQRVLDSVHDGSAQVIGRTRGGDLLVRVDDVFGYNNNFEAGYVDQLTNVFVVKGSTTVSVFPTSPTAGG